MGRDRMDKDEKKWWQSFKRLLGEMPPTIEINARIGAIGIAEAGSRRERFNCEGDADNFSEDEWDEVRVPRLDGRDSHL